MATHRNLQERVKEGLFREDLFYRLAVVPLDVPPLRERREDIPVLVEYLLRETSRDLKIPQRKISPEAVEKLRRYDFPGNVRELRNLVERANILALGEEIKADDFYLQTSDGQSEKNFLDELPESIELPIILESVERDLVTKALQKANGVQAEAARRLGISRSDIAYKIKKYNL